MAEIVHLAGPQITFDGVARQRCAWCGALIEERDLSNMAVATDSSASSEVQQEEANRVALGGTEPQMPGEVEGVQVFRYEGGDLNYQPWDSAPADWDGNLGDLIGDYIRVEDLDRVRSQERQRVREAAEAFFAGELETSERVGSRAEVERTESLARGLLGALDSLEDGDGASVAPRGVENGDLTRWILDALGLGADDPGDADATRMQTAIQGAIDGWFYATCWNCKMRVLAVDAADWEERPCPDNGEYECSWCPTCVAGEAQ